MTRDEAIQIWNDRGHPIDTYVKLGMLKLDAPRSALDLLKSRLVGDFGYSHSTSLFRDLETALKECGLQVVAK